MTGLAIRKAALTLLLAGYLAAAAGCEAFGFLAATVGGRENIPARHTLKKQKTAIVVVDPENHLPQPQLTALIASNTRFHLKQNTELTDKQLVSLQRVRDLRARLGDQFTATPISSVGQQLGAKQVVHVLIRKTQLRYAGSIYRPRATFEVKVVDAGSGELRFPEPGSGDGIGPRGEMVNVELKARDEPTGRRGTTALIGRKLARHIGRKAAEVFYDHQGPSPTDDLQEH